MSATASLLLVMAAAFGGGFAVLRATNVLPTLDRGEQWSWAFAIGFGVLGWCVFFFALFGYIDKTSLMALCAVLSAGCFWARNDAKEGEATTHTVWSYVLIACVFVIGTVDFLEGIAPPTDADSLAYHFAIPKQFLSLGHIEFIARAVDGAVPLLPQMTYLAALGIGGELTLTLWTAASAWGTAAILYTLSRRWLDVTGALAVVVLFMSTPVITLGASSGQVEIRTAMFTLLAVSAIVKAKDTQAYRFALIAGLAVGFFVASKYTGLLMALIGGVTFLTFKRRFRFATVFSLSVLAVGSQWYVWNWWNTGDPVFPILFGLVEYTDPNLWPEEHDHYFRKIMVASEVAVPSNLLWYFLYPIKATLFPDPRFEALRAGFGLAPLILAPFALIGAWRMGRNAVRHPVFLIVSIALGFYTLWFFFGLSQRVRHYTPVLPLVLLGMFFFASYSTSDFRRLFRPFFVALALTLAVNFGALALYAKNFVRFAITSENRTAFLERSVSHYRVVKELNEVLDANDRVMFFVRHFSYYMDTPYFMAHHVDQALVNVRSESIDPFVFLKSLYDQNITHIQKNITASEKGLNGALRLLVARGCLEEFHRVDGVATIGSRTKGATKPPFSATVYHLTPDTCTIAVPPSKDVAP